MKPVVVMTVCRRYHELEAAVARLDDLSGEFAERPDLVVVWARPELGRLWFFDRLREQGKLAKLITRAPLPGEDDLAPTTYPESHNIRLGLEWVRDNYPAESAYALVQAADVWPHAGMAYRFADRHMSEGAGAVVFHWANGCRTQDIWHTNFFATRLDPSYWPPISPPDSQDVLEAQYGDALARAGKGDVVTSHNYESKKFLHLHRSEGREPFGTVPLSAGGSTSLLTSGWLPWWKRLGLRLGLCRPFVRPSDG